jgi:hypothetical protein
MEFVGVKELSKKLSEFINEEDWVVITKNGKPIKIMFDIDGDDLEDIILAKHLDLDSEAVRAKQEHESGKTLSLNQYLKRRRLQK